MRWDQCYGDGGVSNKNFACDTNNGSETLVLSFKPPTDLDQVNGNEITLELRAPSAVLPAWWAFKNTGTCRSTSLSVNPAISASSAACLDEFAGLAISGIGAYNIGYGGGAGAQLRIAEAVPASALATLTGDQEYFALNIVITHSKTVGTGSCAGCLTPVCLLFNEMKITRGGPDFDVTLTDPFATNSWVTTWQGGTPSVYYTPETRCGGSCEYKGWHIGCYLPTPAHSPTWGAIKSMYR
jgi:hypothetical protein